MANYKLDKQVQERLDLTNEVGIKIEEMSPTKLDKFPGLQARKMKNLR